MGYKHVLRLHYINQMSGSEITGSTGNSKVAVNDFLKWFRECEALSYPLATDTTNEFIEEQLYRKARVAINEEFYQDFDLGQLHRMLAHKGESLKHQGQR